MADPKTYTQDEVDELVAGLKENRDEAIKEAKAAKKELREVSGRVAELEHAQKGQKVGLTKDDIDKIRADVRVDLEKEYAPHKQTAETLAQENRRLRLDNVVKAAMAKGGARAERIDALFKLTQDEYDLTDDGQPFLKSRKGTPVEKYVGEDLKTQYPEFFTGTGSSGGGASKSNAGGGGTKTIAADDGKGFMANLEGIAKNEVTVAQP